MRVRLALWSFLLWLAPLAGARAGETVPFAPRTDIPVASSPSAIAAGDLNRDGRADLVTVHPDSDEVWVSLGGAENDFAITGPLRAGTAPCAVEVADVNRDQRRDVVVANSISNTVSVLLGRGDGTF